MKNVTSLSLISKPMFVINKEQFSAIADAQKITSEKRIKEYIAQYYPIVTNSLNDNELTYLLRECVAKANKYGLMQEWKVLLYVSSIILLGIGFEDKIGNKWMSSILNNDYLDSDKKAGHLIDFVKSQLL
ncbi:hypothetical protein [Hymenobacter sp. UYCo722]|uniref:hypothetical protein n=1 Tax=Hymenobacter sp. UYCo722 TaxID=3156335 RepID=UPI00339286C9